MVKHVVMFLALIAWALPARAELRVVGEGKARALDPEQFDKEQRPRYELFKTRCTKCHPMARPISAVLTGITPVSGSPFNHEAVKTYVVKMMRKPNSGISRDDAKEILVFLRHLLDLTGKKDAAAANAEATSAPVDAAPNSAAAP